MLDPTMRELLLDGLRPPQGSRVEAAVATTFTLDLSAALVPPLAFTSFGLEDAPSDPVVLLESLRRATDQVTIFCQAGMIGVPSKATDLMTFLEPMVQQVAPPQRGLFHPKMWLLKLVNESDTAAYRLLVISRNLTHDSSWDVVVRLDSAGVAASPQPNNDGLHSFVQSLASTPGLSPTRRTTIAALAEDVRRVEWEHPPGIESVTFHHLAPGREPIDWRATRACVISPFVNDTGIEKITRYADERHLVARPEQLDMLPPASLKRLNTYVLDPAAGTAPPSDDGDAADESEFVGMKSDLHAKLMVLEPAGSRWTRARVLLGSANATSSALTDNVELMVEMIGATKDFGIDSLIGPEGSMGKLIDDYPAEGGKARSERDELKAQVEVVVRAIAALKHTVTVTPGSDGDHKLTVTAAGAYPRREEWTCQVGLLHRPGLDQAVDLGTAPELEFDGVPTADVSAFVTVTINAPLGVEASTVVLADLENEPEVRLDEVIARQIDSPEKLMRFIRMLLDFGNPAVLAELANPTEQQGSGAWKPGQSGELEMVLRALATQPEVIDNIDVTMRRLARTERGRSVMPDGWEAFWQTVREAREQVRTP